MFFLYPSLPLINLEDTFQAIQELAPHCAGFHFDIMDGIFVSNSGWDILDINTLRTITNKQFWVHLMVSNPYEALEYLDLQAGDMVTLHYESCSNKQLDELITQGKEKLLNMGVAIKPDTPVFTFEKFAHLLGHALIMSVEPGFSGQKLVPHTLKKLESLVQLKKQHNAQFSIAVDGGITQDNLKTVVAHGATHIAVGSAIFHRKSPVEALKKLALY